MIKPLLGSLILALSAMPQIAAAQDVSLSDDPPPVMSGGGGDWDIKFGAIPRGGVFTGELGFSNMPKLTYQMGMSPTLSIGGSFAFDLGYYTPDGAVNPGLLLGVPIRLSLSNQNKLSMGLSFEPGILMYFRGEFRFGLLLNMGFNIGYAINNQFKIGGGIDLPMALQFTPGFGLILPILFGPVLEVHPTPQLAVFFDAKFGPWIGAGEAGSGVLFGLKLGVGIAYKF